MSKPKAAPPKDKTGPMAVATLLYFMRRDGVRLGTDTPERIARLAGEIGESYDETAKFARQMLGRLSTKLTAAPRPEQPQDEPSLKQSLGRILSMASMIVDNLPDGSEAGKKSNTTTLFDLFDNLARAKTGSRAPTKPGKK